MLVTTLVTDLRPSKSHQHNLVTNTAVAICLNYSDKVNDIIPYKDSICAEWEDQLEDHASKNFSELQIEIMKPKLIDAPYQHNCELADEYSVLSNRTGCIRKSVISWCFDDLAQTSYARLCPLKPRYYITEKLSCLLVNRSKVTFTIIQ